MAFAEYEEGLIRRGSQPTTGTPQVGMPARGGTDEGVVPEQPPRHLQQRDVQAMVSEAGRGGESHVIPGPVAEVVARQLRREAESGRGGRPGAEHQSGPCL